MNIRNICMHCMSDQLNEKGECAACGKTEKEIKATPWRMPLRTILKGKYLIGKVLGEGGFGITYIGYDLDLEICVAIKEFCPKSYAGRDAEDGLTLYLFDESKEEEFAAERDKFINEARRLAKFRNEGGVVSVLDYFIENGTAYIVMDYIDGITLKSYLKTLRDTTGRSMNMAGVLNLFKPVMETLAKIHKSGIIHRDISPENIMISKDFTKVYLIDFGTARNVESSQTLSEYYKGFYSPIEQRSSQRKGKMEQGPWTDVYALCATIYVCITGRVMSDSVSRITEDDLIRPSKFGVAISPSMEEVLLKGLAVKPEDRIRSMEELMQAFYGVQISVENVTQKPVPDTYVAVEASKPMVNNVAQVFDNNMQRIDVENSNYAMEKQKFEGELKGIKTEENINLILSTILFLICIFMFVDGIRSDEILFSVLGIGIYLPCVSWNFRVANRGKNFFLEINPSIGKVQIQIEKMRSSKVYYNGYKIREHVNPKAYKAVCIRHREESKNQCHLFEFILEKKVRIELERHKLINYYYQTILPSNLPEELKAEWKQAAIDSWIMMEDL